MTTVPVPPAVQRMVDATNRGDSEAFVETFSDDAYLNDWGREFHGRAGAASWNETDNIGVKARFELVDVRPGDAEGRYLVDLTVTSNRFNGAGTFDIHVAGDHITRLVIAA